MKKLIGAFLFMLSLSFATNAQDYNTGIGFRGGSTNGITVKHFISSNTSVEGILGSRWKGFNVTGLYEIHANAFNTPQLNWYYGFGGHLGSYSGSNNRYSDGDNHLVVGVDGIVGIEYNIKEIPFNIGLDWKPTLDLIGGPDFWGDELALSIRYIF